MFRYDSFSLKFYDILLKHAHLLQAVSMDEGLLEVKVAPTISRDRDPALALAHKIRAEIFEATGCPASIGISHNITLARLATRKAKPASAYHLLPEDVAAFLGPLDVDSLPGIGWSLRKKLADELQVSTVGQLLRVPLRQLEAIGSGNAKKFLAFAKGIDDNEIKVEQVRKSVSAEVNYGIRFEEGRNDQVEVSVLRCPNA
jgi:DNA repair protein REV1